MRNTARNDCWTFGPCLAIAKRGEGCADEEELAQFTTYDLGIPSDSHETPSNLTAGSESEDRPIRRLQCYSYVRVREVIAPCAQVIIAVQNASITDASHVQSNLINGQHSRSPRSGFVR